MTNQIELKFVSPVIRSFSKTFDHATTINLIKQEILGVHAEIFDLYHHDKLLELDQTIQDTEITSDSNAVNIVPTKKFELFMKAETIVDEIDYGFVEKYTNNPRSLFRLEMLMRLSTLMCKGVLDADNPDKDILELVSLKLSHKFFESGFDTPDSYIAFYPKTLIKKTLTKLSAEEILEVLDKADKARWSNVHYDRYLKVYQGPGFSILGIFEYMSPMAFLQYEDTFVFIARAPHYTCLMFNGFHHDDENYFMREYGLNNCGRRPSEAIERMRGMCRTLVKSDCGSDSS